MSKFKVINTLADGTIIDDMTGYEVPYNEATKGYYQILSSIIDKEIKKELEKRHEKKQQTHTLDGQSVATQ